MKVGDMVQYRSAMGELMGYAVIVKKLEYWTVIHDIHTGKQEYWCDTLMTRIVK